MSLLWFLILAMPREVDLEQRTVLKGLVRSQTTPIQAWNFLQTAYGEAAFGKTAVRKWHKRFREDIDTPVKDKPRTGRPHSGHSPASIGVIHNLLLQDQRKSVRTLSEESNIPTATVHRILKKDLNLRLVCAKFIPRILRSPLQECGQCPGCCQTSSQGNGAQCVQESHSRFARQMEKMCSRARRIFRGPSHPNQ